jgi:hypothetical protein
VHRSDVQKHNVFIDSWLRIDVSTLVDLFISISRLAELKGITREKLG